MREKVVLLLAGAACALGACGSESPDKERVAAAVDRITAACAEPGGLASADASNRVTESVDAIIEEYRKDPDATIGKDPVTGEPERLRDSAMAVATMLDTLCGGEDGKRLERALGR